MGGLYHGWDDEPDTHADFVHGAVPINDFDETFRHKKKRGKKRHPKGCPGNDGKAHVYVWVPYTTGSSFLWGLPGEYEIKVCCGCDKRAGGKSFRRTQT